MSFLSRGLWNGMQMLPISLPSLEACPYDVQAKQAWIFKSGQTPSSYKSGKALVSRLGEHLPSFGRTRGEDLPRGAAHGTLPVLGQGV